MDAMPNTLDCSDGGNYDYNILQIAKRQWIVMMEGQTNAGIHWSKSFEVFASGPMTAHSLWESLKKLPEFSYLRG